LWQLARGLPEDLRNSPFQERPGISGLVYCEPNLVIIDRKRGG
jgi:hypothetical protein